MPANTESYFSRNVCEFSRLLCFDWWTATSIVLDSQGFKVGQQKIMIWSS